MRPYPLWSTTTRCEYVSGLMIGRRHRLGTNIRPVSGERRAMHTYLNLSPLSTTIVIFKSFFWGAGGPWVVVSTAAFHARDRVSFPGLDGLKETKMFLPHPLIKLSIAGSLRDREVACSALDRQGSNFESCAWRAVSSHSSHHPQEVLLAQFSL